MRPGGVARPLLLLLALVALLPTLAGAEHDLDHRYFIVGTVTGASGEPLCGVTVRAVDVSVPSNQDTNRTGTTDGSGRYRIQLHLHSSETGVEESNEGDTLLVTVEGTSAVRTTTAVVNGINPDGWGQQSVDLSTTEARSRCLGAAEVAMYGAIAALGVGGAAAVVLYLRRPRGGRGYRDLLSVPGVTRARARELDAAGIRDAKALAKADPEALSKATSLTPSQARFLVRRAQGMRGPKD